MVTQIQWPLFWKPFATLHFFLFYLFTAPKTRNITVTRRFKFVNFHAVTYPLQTSPARNFNYIVVHPRVRRVLQTSELARCTKILGVASLSNNFPRFLLQFDNSHTYSLSCTQNLCIDINLLLQDQTCALASSFQSLPWHQ
jgi:hypothetical protein